MCDVGPRFETRAEIRFLATVGHVVGMTAAHEIPLFCEEPAVPVAVVRTRPVV
jgi:purine nucleoside phosphorylase